MTKKHLLGTWLLIVLLCLLIGLNKIAPKFILSFIANKYQLDNFICKTASLQIFNRNLQINELSFVHNNIKYHAKQVDINIFIWQKIIHLVIPNMDIELQNSTKFNLEKLTADLSLKKIKASINNSSFDSIPKGLYLLELDNDDLKTKGRISILLHAQKYLETNLQEQTLSIPIENELIYFDKTALNLNPCGLLKIDGSLNYLNDEFKLNIELEEASSQSFDFLPKIIDADLSGNIETQGSYSDINLIMASGQLKIEKGRLIDVDIIKLSNTLNLLMKMKELPLKLNHQDHQIDSYFPLKPSIFQVKLKQGYVLFDGAFTHEMGKHILRLKGEYGLNEDDWRVRVKYDYPSNPLGIRFKLNGKGDSYKIRLDAIDLIRVLPTVFIPNLINAPDKNEKS